MSFSFRVEMFAAVQLTLSDRCRVRSRLHEEDGAVCRVLDVVI
jgi:hypothetical protein